MSHESWNCLIRSEWIANGLKMSHLHGNPPEPEKVFELQHLDHEMVDGPFFDLHKTNRYLFPSSFLNWLIQVQFAKSKEIKFQLLFMKWESFFSSLIFTPCTIVYTYTHTHTPAMLNVGNDYRLLSIHYV